MIKCSVNSTYLLGLRAEPNLGIRQFPTTDPNIQNGVLQNLCALRGWEGQGGEVQAYGQRQTRTDGGRHTEVKRPVSTLFGVVESHPVGVATDRRLRNIYAPGIGGGDPQEGTAGKEGVTHPAAAA